MNEKKFIRTLEHLIEDVESNKIATMENLLEILTEELDPLVTENSRLALISD